MSAGPPLYFTVIDKSVLTSDITNPRLSHIFAKQDQVAWLFLVAKRTYIIVVSNDGLSFYTQHAPHDKEEFASVRCCYRFESRSDWNKSNTHVQHILTLSGKFMCTYGKISLQHCVWSNHTSVLPLFKIYCYAFTVLLPQSKIYGYVFTVSALELKSKGGRLQSNWSPLLPAYWILFLMLLVGHQAGCRWRTTNAERNSRGIPIRKVRTARKRCLKSCKFWSPTKINTIISSRISCPSYTWNMSATSSCFSIKPQMIIIYVFGTRSQVYFFNRNDNLLKCWHGSRHSCPLHVSSLADSIS